MKKIILSLALLLAISPITASAYTVKPGDTLWKIAKANNTTWQQIAEDNNIENPNLIFAGQELSVGQLGAVTPQPRLLGDNTWTGTNTFNGTTSLGTTTFSSVNSLLVTGGLSILQNTFTASEYITKGQAVIIGDNTTSTGDGNIASSASTAYTMNATTWLSHYFTTSNRAIFIKEVSIYSAGVSTSRTLTISIRSADGSYKPIGSDIGGITATTTIGTSAGWNKVIFSTPVPVNPSSNYAIVARSSGDSTWNTNNVTSGGDRNASSSDSGVTWSNYSSGSQRLMFLIAENQSVNGQISRADASINNSLANNFIGFAAENIATSTSGLVTINGIDNNQSDLTVGAIYYLSDTSGAISSIAGTISRKIGLAVSSTQILIKHDNP